MSRASVDWEVVDDLVADGWSEADAIRFATSKVHTPEPADERAGAAGSLAGTLLNTGTDVGLGAAPSHPTEAPAGVVSEREPSGPGSSPPTPAGPTQPT